MLDRMVEWMRAHHPAAAFLALASGAILWTMRFAFTRHREYLAITAHMAREEKEVWPALTKQLADNHQEAMVLLHQHGERISKLEGRMPNGELAVMKGMLERLLTQSAGGRR